MKFKAGNPIKLVAFDLDGVIYQGRNALSGAVKTVRAFREKGLTITFLSNNSARSRAEIAKRLTEMGIEATCEDVYTSSFAAIRFLREHCSGSGGKRVFVLAEPYLADELSQNGFEVTTKPPYDYFVVGFKPDFNYGHIAASISALEESGCFVICNRDRLFPVEGGRLMPASGAIVASIETVSGRKPDHEAGKPNPDLLRFIAGKHDLRPEEILMVGDSLASDIAMAVDFGCPSVLVRSSGLSEYEKRLCPSMPVPDAAVESIANIKIA